MVINFLLLICCGWLVGEKTVKVVIQRFRCAKCGCELHDQERKKQKEARETWWQLVQRLIALSRFKLGLSVRKTRILVKFIYGLNASVSFIVKYTHVIGSRAEGILNKLNDCSQKCSRFLMFDETFPKLLKRTWSMGVAICEKGLIRSVRIITDKAKNIEAQLSEVVGKNYQPVYFLTDLDQHYGKYQKNAELNLIHLRDVVHTIRWIIRLFDEAVKNVSLSVPKKTSSEERKRQLKIKKKLLSKRLRPLLNNVLKAFKTGNEAVCVLKLCGVLTELQILCEKIKIPSLLNLAKRFESFLKKYESPINTLLELSEKESAPKTTNALESKNSIFKTYSLIAKFFPSTIKCQLYFSGVALMENFSIKERGKNKNSSAMQRAGIDFEEIGGNDFFDAVGLPNPQLSIPGITIS